MSTDDSVAIMKQMLAGIAHAHKSGIIHRDIKPENILIHERCKSSGFTSPGVVKVTDFGLGKAATISMGQSIAFSASMNAEDAKRISGTLDYMAPEQRSGGEIDHRADLYACGVILYEMLTGERPAGTEVPSDINPKSPKYLDDVFRRSYARLEKRFTSAEQFLASLSASSSPPPLPPPLPWQRQAETTKQCPSCRRAVAAGDQFCMHCGVQLVEWVLRCPQCGAYPDPADRFCIFCGVAVSPQTVA